jgi:hypothetical protein
VVGFGDEPHLKRGAGELRGERFDAAGRLNKPSGASSAANVQEVGLGGSLGHDQPSCDLPVAQPLGDQRGNTMIAVRQ